MRAGLSSSGFLRLRDGDIKLHAKSFLHCAISRLSKPTITRRKWEESYAFIETGLAQVGSAKQTFRENLDRLPAIMDRESLKELEALQSLAGLDQSGRNCLRPT